MSHRASTPSRSLVFLVVLVLVLGLGLTLWAAHAARVREAQRIEGEFRAEAQALARAVEREMALFTSVLASLGELHTLSEGISAADFAEFARKGLLHQKAILGPFGFAQRIPLEVRVALETPSDGDAAAPPQLSIVEWGDQGLQSAEIRPEYYPLTYQSSDQGLGFPDGFDLATLNGQREAIARMQAGGGPAIGAVLRAADPAAPAGFLVSAPIGEGGQFTGFTVARLWPQELLERALRQVRVRQVQVTFYDPMYGRPPAASTAVHVGEWPVALADQRWVLRCEAGVDYQQGRASPASALIRGGGSAATLLLALVLGLLATRARAIERTVRERTAELEHANRQLAAEMDERARLEEAMHTAALREKQRIGHDLHDSLGQKLTGAVYLARSLSHALPQAEQGAVDKLVDLLKDAVAQVRRTARGLAPLEVGEDGLAPGLRRLAEETCDVFNIACSFREEGSPAFLSSEAAVHLYHIAQEAVNNAIRHGEAREIRIELTPRALRIIDNGRGFDASATVAGAGLRIMRHRATRAGARLDIHSTPGSGATIAILF
ncbi:MAG TPA: CHASE domain-containing protein [Kiritimatiellia bacterium]|nr:CHASE domain-containing protein [Kiritimatiellia bacterium]